MKHTNEMAAILAAGVIFLGGCGSDEAEPAAAPDQLVGTDSQEQAEAPAQPAPEATGDDVGEIAEAVDITLPSGVVIRDLIVGDGAEAQPGGTVVVHCVGTLTDGKEFWSSYTDQDGEKPITFPLPELIQAWQEGIPGMKVGGKRQLTCPPETAYGSEEKRNPDGSVSIPANSTLIFVIELLEVK